LSTSDPAAPAPGVQDTESGWDDDVSSWRVGTAPRATFPNASRSVIATSREVPAVTLPAVATSTDAAAEGTTDTETESERTASGAALPTATSRSVTVPGVAPPFSVKSAAPETSVTAAPGTTLPPPATTDTATESPGAAFPNASNTRARTVVEPPAGIVPSAAGSAASR
jgi:hypothetical protein